MRLKDKVAVIVGGASELATATGRRFLAEGAKLILIHHNQPSLDRALQLYGGENVATQIADVRDLCGMQKAFAAVVKSYCRIDVLVNCAGIARHKPIDDLTTEDWQAVIDVNLTGAFNVSKAVAPIMKNQKSGRIIHVGSLGGRTGRPGVGVNYAASKAGLSGLTQTLARELAPWGITANVVAPGPLKGRMFGSMQPESREQLSAGIPLGRVGEMSEVAGAILFFASEDATWITGEVLDVNGGIYM
jgi:NAD(P)-dependent dehydrogenase (short-subunit alcohol dehydrogenase family)